MEEKTITVPLALFEEMMRAFIEIAKLKAFPPIITNPDGSFTTVSDPIAPAQVFKFNNEPMYAGDVR